MSVVVADKWVEKVVAASLAKFLENPTLWPGEAARLDTVALKALVESLRTALLKSPKITAKAKEARLRYCNGAYKRLILYQQRGVIAELANPKLQRNLTTLLSKAPTDLDPSELIVKAPLYEVSVIALKGWVEANGWPAGAGAAQQNRQTAKKKMARKGAVAEARTARDRARLIGSRLVRYHKALAANTSAQVATALLLFNELYGSLRAWLVAYETGGILDLIDPTYPTEMRAFKGAFKKQKDGYVVRRDYLDPPQALRVYEPSWDRKDPNVVADWLWKANGRNLPIDTFLAAYPTDAQGEAALEAMLMPSGDTEPQWVLSGRAFDALARARDYYTGAVFKRTLAAEECLSSMQQSAAKLRTLAAASKTWPAPWTQQQAAEVEAEGEAAVEKKFPRFDLRTLVAETQIGRLKTIGSGTRYSEDIVLSVASARDPWISNEMLSNFANQRLQRWNHRDFGRLWDDASYDFMRGAQSENTVEIREDGTQVTDTGRNFKAWKLEVIGKEGFYQYRAWCGGIDLWHIGVAAGSLEEETRQGPPSAADLMKYKLPEEDTDAFIARLIEANKVVWWTDKKGALEYSYAKYEYRTSEKWLRAVGPKERPQRKLEQDGIRSANPIQDILDGVPPVANVGELTKDGVVSHITQRPVGFIMVPRIIPYGLLGTSGDKTGSLGFDSKLPGFLTAIRNGLSTRARFYLGFLNDDYGIFNPSSRTGIAVLEQMFKYRGSGSGELNKDFIDKGGLYSVAWPASRSWVSLGDSPPTSAEQVQAQQDPMTSDYEGGLRSLQAKPIGALSMGEIIEAGRDATGALAKGFFSMGLLWRMTRGKAGAGKQRTYGGRSAPTGKKSEKTGKVGAPPLVPNMYWFEAKYGIPEASPALQDLGRKLKSQRKLERIGLYTYLFNESFRAWVGETEGASGALSERYNANWVGYRPRDYSTVKETGSKSLSKSLMRWSPGPKGIHLYDYQSDAVLRMDDQQGGLLAFDVGVGKTLCALAAIAYARQNGNTRRVLCVVPNTIQRQWLQEFQGRLPDYNVVILGQTLRAPSKVPAGGAPRTLFIEMAHRGNRDDSKGPLGGWIWRAVRDYKLPEFKKEGIPWRGKDKAGWRMVEADAKRIASQLILQGGSVEEAFPHLVPFVNVENAQRKFPGLPRSFQKASRDERAQRWIAFSEGQYDAMICSEVDFATIAMKPATLRQHLNNSPALRSMLINQTFKGSSTAAGGGLRQRLSDARKALKEWGAVKANPGGQTTEDVRKWVLDATITLQDPKDPRMGTVTTVTIPPHLGIPSAGFPSVGDALRDFIKRGIYEMENFSGKFWDDTVEKFTSDLFGPARDTPDEAARAKYAALFGEPLFWAIEDAKGQLLLTNGDPKQQRGQWWRRQGVKYPSEGPRSDIMGIPRYPSAFRFDKKPFNVSSEAVNGSIPLAYASMATLRGSYVYPDGVGAGRSSCIGALDYQGPDARPVPARYSALDKGWVGVPLGFVSAGDYAKKVAALLTAEQKKRSVGSLVQGYDPLTNEALKKVTGPFKAVPLATWGRGKPDPTKPVRLPTLNTQDRRDRVARDYSMLPKLYDTQAKWNQPPSLYFEDLRVDCIVCDEAHKYKALFAPRERGGKVAYLQSGQSSKRAWAMEARCANIKERNGRVMLLTATPAKTSPLEFYNVMQLIGAPGLGGDLSVFSQFGIYTSEQFISRFVKIEDTIIIDADGTTRRGAAATAFVHLDREFTAIFHRYANRKTVLDVKTLRGTQVGRGQGAVYKAGEPEILIPKGNLSKLKIGDRFQLLTGNSKGGYRVQGFLGATTQRNGVVIMPPPDKDSSQDTVLQGDNWISYTAGKVPLGPPPAVVDVPLDEDQRNLYGGFQKALSRMILEDMNRAVVKVGGQAILTTKKLKVYPSMSRLTMHPMLEQYTFEVEIIDTTAVEAADAATKRAVANRFAQGLALGLEKDVDPVDALMALYKVGQGPWAFFGAPAPTDKGVNVQKGGLTAKIPVLSPAYALTLAKFKALAQRVREGEVLSPDEVTEYERIAAEFHPDKKEAERQNWAKPFTSIKGEKYVGSLKLHSKTGVPLNPGGITNVLTGALQAKDVINVASPRLAAMIDRVLARAIMDDHTQTNVPCGNIAFCGNLYIHAWTVVYWSRLYALTKMLEEWCLLHTKKGVDPDAGPWIDAVEYYGLTTLYWTTANVLRIALPKADFTLTPSAIEANNQEPQTLLAVEIMEFVLEGEGEPDYVGEAAAYRQAGVGTKQNVPIFRDFRYISVKPEAQPLKDSFDGYYVEGANRIVAMNSEVAPGPARQDITDAFNGEWGKDSAGGDCAVVRPKFDLLVANSVAYEGVDLQARTCAIHHLDLPWTPSDFIQRQGRGVRQGNLFEVVDSYVYLSRNTVDYFRLQALERKRAWLESALDADSPTFELASNEAELLQLACQSVHPDDVEAVCRKAAQKLLEIKREKLVKEFNPLKGTVRGTAEAARVAFIWHTVGIQKPNAENRYKEFLHGARSLREPDTRLMLDPILIRPSLVDLLQQDLLVGADPENLQQGLDNLHPASVGVTRSPEDPSDRAMIPFSVEGAFLGPMVVASGASILQIPGVEPVVFRKEAVTGQTSGRWDVEEPTPVVLPFGGLYMGVYVPGRHQVWALDVRPRGAGPEYLQDASVVRPGRKVDGKEFTRYGADWYNQFRKAPPIGWKLIEVGRKDERATGTHGTAIGAQYGVLMGYAATKQDDAMETLHDSAKWHKNGTKAYPWTPPDGLGSFPHHVLRRVGSTFDGDGKKLKQKIVETWGKGANEAKRKLPWEYDERTWPQIGGVSFPEEAVMPYNPGVWPELLKLKLVAKNSVSTESIFHASCENSSNRMFGILLGGGVLWEQPGANWFHTQTSSDRLAWVSGAATPWVEQNWQELTYLIARMWMGFIWTDVSIEDWAITLKSAAKKATRSPFASKKDREAPVGWHNNDPVREILVDAYERLVPLPTAYTDNQGREKDPDDPATAAAIANEHVMPAQKWLLRAFDYNTAIPFLVGKKLWVSDPGKMVRSSAEQQRLLLSGVVANWLMRERLAAEPPLDPALIQAEVKKLTPVEDETRKALKKAEGALDRIAKGTYKGWEKMSDEKKGATTTAAQEAVAKAKEAWEEVEYDLDTAKHLQDLLASQAVSIIPPTLPGLRVWAVAVQDAEGIKGATPQIGTVSLAEVQRAAKNWWRAYEVHGASSPWAINVDAFAAKTSAFQQGYGTSSAGVWTSGGRWQPGVVQQDQGSLWGKKADLPHMKRLEEMSDADLALDPDDE